MDRGDAIRLARGLMDERSANLVARVDAGQRRAHGYRDAAVGDAGRRLCPVCHRDLIPTTTHAHVEIDVCEKHGVFFDAGEIRAVNRAATATRRRTTAAAEAKLEATAAMANLELAKYAVGRNLFDVDEVFQAAFGDLDD